jgi:hypothetical protein
MDLGIFDRQLEKTFFHFSFSVLLKMASNTTTSAGQELTNLAMEGLNRARIDPQTASTMSRRRLFFVQMNSLIICVLTCLTICVVTLTRVSSIPEFLFGPCGIFAKLLLQNLSDASSLTSAAISAAVEASEECKI